MSGNRWESIAQMRADRRARIAERFKDHRAELQIFAPGVEEIRWGKPGTGIDRITFLIHGPRLIVTGDLGDAIYIRAQGWQFWASCDLDYFASKCEASDTGRLAREWDSDRAELYMADVLNTTVAGLREEDEKGKREENTEDEDEQDEEEWVPRALRLFRERDGAAALCGEFDWIEWIRENGHDVFGGDYYEYGEVGKDVSYRCVFHLEGVKAATRQLGLLEQERVA